MNRNALLAGLGAGLLLAAGSAQAADCAGQIMAMQERIDAMPVPASSQGAGGVGPDSKPTARIVETNRADTRADAAGGAAPLPTHEGAHTVPNGSGETAATPAPIDERDAAGGVLVQRDSDMTEPTVPSPDPVEPMDEDEIQAKETNPVQPGEPADLDTAAAAQDLARAQAYYQAGDEAACLDAIAQARGHLSQP